MKSSLYAVALSSAASIAVILGAVAPAAAVPETELKPAQLARGADVAVPHLEGKTVVDGDVRVPIEAGMVRLLGTSGADYIVGASNKQGSGEFRTLRVTPDGDKTALVSDVNIWELVLSDDGSQLADTTYLLDSDHRTRIRVFSAVDGSRQAARTFEGIASVLDVDGGHMLLGASGPNRTFSWNIVNDATRKLFGREGYAADISANRVASLTGDPYRGGCTVVTTVSYPLERLWKSCDEGVDTFSPNGRRMATINILSDGPGPIDVWLRKTGGKTLAHYSAEGFGQVWWESGTSLLLDTLGIDKAGTVRCQVAECERASDLRPRPDYRVMTPARP